MGAGVGIAHDNSITGTDKSFFREQGMADAVSANIKKIFDVMSACPVSHNFGLGGGLGIFGRCDVVNNRFDLDQDQTPGPFPCPSDQQWRWGW